jgi:hypothetical protein
MHSDLRKTAEDLKAFLGCLKSWKDAPSGTVDIAELDAQLRRAEAVTKTFRLDPYGCQMRRCGARLRWGLFEHRMRFLVDFSGGRFVSGGITMLLLESPLAVRLEAAPLVADLLDEHRPRGKYR